MAAAVVASRLPAATPARALGQPHVSSLLPALGQLEGGTLVTIRGSGFLGAVLVRFGALPAGFVVVSDGEILAVTPPGDEGIAQVRVATTDATSPDAGLGDDYRYHIQPRISSISPQQGLDMGGGTVTISGSGFTGATSVRFGRAAAPFTLASSGRITVTLPPKDPRDPGAVDVVVSNAWARSTTLLLASQDDFRYFPTPRITSVAPYEGPSIGGFHVWIKGSGFTDATTVSFGSIAVEDLRVDATGSEIYVEAPAHSVGRVKITVGNPGGVGPARTDSVDTLGFFDVSGLEDALLKKINDHRASKAKNRLATSGALADGAYEWSSQMAENGLQHDSSNWCPAGFRYCGELVQSQDYDGSSTAAAFVETLFQAFKASPDHNGVMLYAFSHNGSGFFFDGAFAYVTVRFGQT